MAERQVFLIKPKHQFIYPSVENELLCPIIKRKKIIMWIHVYPIEKYTLILQMAEKNVFPRKPKRQYHLSQWGESVYVAQSWNEIGLLYELVCIPIEKETLILKMVQREVFLRKPKHQFIYPNTWNEFVVPNH